uniref:Caspase recruitment domain family, member 19 n=1 Tax=Dicentrarchus labrax TaxID=13489 RepID=A0A8C4GU32_DICLA
RACPNEGQKGTPQWEVRDSAFLKADRRLDTELLDKLILQLNRIYPQILTDKEATKFRNLDVPTSVRVGELLTHLQAKGEEACREFYRALHLHVEEVYYSLPTRLRLRGPLFFLGCFSVAVGMALFYYYSGKAAFGTLLSYVDTYLSGLKGLIHLRDDHSKIKNKMIKQFVLLLSSNDAA